MMTEQRAFWISGLGTLAVVVLLGSALWARTKTSDSNLTALPAPSVSVPLGLPGPDDPLREELKVAYNDLDMAYREIERLQDTGGQEDNHDDDDDDDDDDDEEDQDDQDEGRGDRYDVDSENDDHR